MKKSKLALTQSIIALLLCASMLIGTTFAWFSESISGSNNVIAAGNLDVELEYRDKTGAWKSVTEASTLFEENALWEPGHTEVIYLKLSNLGSLAVKYQFGVNVVQETGSVNIDNVPFKLSEYIHFGILHSDKEVEYATRDDARAALENAMPINAGYGSEGALYPQDNDDSLASEQYVTLVAYMPEDVGNAVNYKTGETPASIYLGIAMVASQQAYEKDSFDESYDVAAELPKFDFPVPSFSASASADVTKDDQNKVSQDVTFQSGNTSVSVPTGVQMSQEAEKLILTVSTMEATGSNVVLSEGESILSLDVHMDGVDTANTTPMTITLKGVAPKGLNAGNLKLYHVENGETVTMEAVDTFTAHNQFKYNPTTGDLTLYMATFSEVAVVADTENAWNGTVATAFGGGEGTEVNPYLISNADQLAYLGDRVSNDNATYGSAYYKLMSDINIGGIENYNTNGRKVLWYPIGYSKVGGTTSDKGNWYTYGGSFKGVFDGAGHTISGIYQNTWAMVGNYDGTYYKEAMGLFGYVNGGTVKNLTIDNFYSEGEFAPTGCVTAYAAGNAIFENIAITNSHPQTYNTGVAGIVGWDNGGDTADEASNFTFKNITVDSSNTISALWGSWDVAAAGLLGYLGEYSTADLTNCHVSATIDVYNDVCGNYQYYWYRYCGMLIGTVDKTKDDGSLDLSNISATGCTVDFGNRHEYYYCEYVANSKASYTHDYQFSRVNNEDITIDENGDATCNHDHAERGTEVIDGVEVLVEDKQAVHIPFRQVFGGYGWGVKGTEITEDGIDIDDITVDIEVEPDKDGKVKFESKFTGNFLYRVGNANTVSVGSLFEAKDGAPDINTSGVYVKIDKVYDESDVSCTFTANTDDWAKSTLQFSGTGVVDISIQDYDYCTPTSLHLEIVDGVNATTATSATGNNVVLLNDCGFSSLEVSEGYTLYGNGFTMTCGSDSVASDMGYAFVTLDSGTLDNVQIVCPNFDYAALYKSNLTSSDNRSETDTSGKTRYYNAKSGVMASGNSQILNSRISGARAAVNVSGGNVVIDNSRIELGAVASILVGAANSVTLRDVTLVQKPTTSTYDSSKTLLGFSVLLMCNSTGDAAPVMLEGTLVQNAWVDESDSQYVPSAGQSVVETVLQNDEYLHDIDGDGTNESLNLGFAYMPESLTSAVNATTITDNRTNKDAIPYDYAEVSIMNGTTYVYSYKNESGTDNSFKEDEVYTPDTYGDIIALTYSDTTEGLTTGKSYGTDGWIYELNVDLDTASGYALDFSKLSMSINGVPVDNFTVNGSDKPTSPVAVTEGGTTYTLTASVDDKEYTATFKVTGTETSKESPSLVASNYEAALLVGEAGSKYGNKDTWHGAAPVLNGIQIKYWSVAEKQYKTIILSDYTPATAGKQNGTNNTWTYSPDNSDFTLTITGGQVHSSNNVNAIPVVCNSKLYFVAASSSGLVNYGNSARTIPVTYSFKDNNGGDELTFSNTWSIECADRNTAYDYSEFCNGTSSTFTISSSNGCFAEGTLITLADGTQKPIEQITYEDELLVWDFNTGAYAVTTASLIESHEADEYRVINLKFADGTVARVVVDHGFFDVEENNFVYIDEENVESYIGHSFVKVGADGTYENTELVGYEITVEKVSYYTIQTAIYNNCIAENMFTLTSPSEMIQNEGWFDYFEIGDNMKYDEEKKQADIEKYGLYTYEDFAEYVTYEQFIAFNGPYLKVLVGRGVVTFEEILELIATYVPN